MLSKIKLYSLLILFGLVLGGVPSYFLWRTFNPKVEGTHFENLEDLRNQIQQRDNRDITNPNSVSLRTLIESDLSDEIIYKLKPNLDLTFQGVNVKTNSFGMRGPEISIEKPAGTYRIALLGDSFTFGWGVKEDECFARIFEKNLIDSKKLGDKVEVLNFGVPGYSTFQETARYINDQNKFNPDAIVIYFVDNDFGLPFFIGGADNPLEDVVKFVKRSWSNEDQETTEKHKLLNSLLDPNLAIGKLLDFVKDKGTKVMLVVNPGGKNIKGVYSRLWVLKKRTDLINLKIYDDLKKEIEEKQIDKSTLQLPNDPHPSLIKHEMIGRAMANEFLLVENGNN